MTHSIINIKFKNNYVVDKLPSIGDLSDLLIRRSEVTFDLSQYHQRQEEDPLDQLRDGLY
jgi:hypothetical protein